MTRPRTVRFMIVFAVPALIAITSLTGLVVALLDDGAWDVIGWIGLGIPVAVLVWARFARPST
jgi:hypothetical protein